MKLKALSQIVGASALALTMATLPVKAQQNTTTTTPGQTGGTTTTTETQGDRDFDWGWLGLIGLAGLAGLAGGKKSSDEPTRYREPDVAGRTGYRE